MKRLVNYINARRVRFIRYYIIQSINYARKEHGQKNLIPEVEVKYTYSVDSIGTGITILEISYQRECRKLKAQGYRNLAYA